MRRLLTPLLPVDRFTRGDRRITVTIWMAGLLQGFAQAQASASLPYTRAGLGLTEGEMSLLLGVARLGGFVALPLAWWADRHGRRRPFLVAVTVIVVGGAAGGLAVDAWHFGLAQAVMRTGTAAVSGLALVILAETVSRPVRAYSISMYGAAVSFGSGLALMTLPIAAGGGEAWRTPFLLVGTGLLLVPLLVRRVPETTIYRDDPDHGGGWSDIAFGRWAKRFWLVAGAAFLASAYGTVGTSFSTTRLVEYVGLSPEATVVVLIGASTVGGIGFFLGGRLAETRGRRSTSAACILLALLGGVAMYTVETIPLVIAATFLSSLATFVLVPASGSHRTELFPTALRSSAITAVANAALAGSAAGLILGNFTIDRIGLTNTVLVLGVGMAVAAVLTLMLPETRGQDLTAVATADR